MKRTLFSAVLVISLNANAVLGPLPIYLNTEYRTKNPMIGSIASTTILNRTQIEATGANTVLELLSTISSITVFNASGNIPAIFIRGAESGHTLFLVDGVKIHDIASTNGSVGYALGAIPLDQIEKIEIVKGPYSSLYGSGAIGGIVQIFTKKYGNYNNLNITVGSNNGKKVAFSTAVKDEKGFVNFNISKYTTDGVSALTSNVEKDGVDNSAINFRLGYNISKKTNIALNLAQSNQDKEYDDNFGAGAPIVYQHNKLWVQKLTRNNITINHHFNDSVNSKLSFDRISQNKDSFTNGVSDGSNKKKYKNTDLTLLNDIKLDKALLNIGLSQIKDQNITDNQSLSSQDVFVQWQKNIGDFDVNTGARHINHSNFGKHTTYNLGVAKNINNGIKLTVSYGTAFGAPSLYQLFNNDSFAKGNLDLKPETSKNIEFGISKMHDWGTSRIKFYKNKIKDIIVYRNTATIDYHNENKLNIKGIELSTSANVQGYQINLSHNNVKSNLNNSNTQQNRRPKNTTELSINKKYGKFNSGVQMTKKSSSLDGVTTLAGYTLVNLSASYQYNDKTKLSLNINNATNKNYEIAKGYNQIGRTINLGFSLNF